MTGQPTGWPFLIAAGRHRDYSILLAPDFLVRELDYGFLDETVKPGNGRPRVVDVRTRAGRHLSVVSATHILTPEDAGATHDEYGRPLRLLYGFICGNRVVEPDPADLATALSVALDTFRRFLDHEEVPVVASGRSFTLHSTVIRQPEPTVTRRPQRRARVGVSIVGGAAAVALAALALTLWPRPQPETPVPRPQPATPAPCPSATVALEPIPNATAPASCAVTRIPSRPAGGGGP